jgi:hypothetical protein
MLVGDSLSLRPFERVSNPATGFDELVPVGGFEVQFFAPYKRVGHRLSDLPVMQAEFVTAAHPGIYLFHLWWDKEYIVGRLQVHSQLVDWWFGQDSITTGRDAIGHSQPSIYASFTDADPEVDLVGDITDSGLVVLTSTDTAKLVVDPGGRLRGLVETQNDQPVTLEGRFRTGGPVKELPVRIVDYVRSRPILEPLRIERLAEADTVPNIVFLAEGFLAEDRDRFDAIVTRIAEDMFEKPRHEPFGMLSGSVNMFKAFAASQQRGVTVGNRIRDIGGDHDGRPIPSSDRPGGDDTYSLSQLIELVGPACRGESRSATDILSDWKLRRLGIDEAKINATLIEAWRTERSDSLLDARDTYFGLMLGSRLADGVSRGGERLDVPQDDDPASAAVLKLQRRLYGFYASQVMRSITSDDRRHPPELQLAADDTPRRTSIAQYLGSLAYSHPPFQPIGPAWVPDTKKFKPSRGLVGFVVQDWMFGGTNINDLTMCAVSIQGDHALNYEHVGSRLRRLIPGPIPVNDLDDLGNTFAHEFGHSLHLGDEYEEFDGLSGSSETAAYFDNLATRYEIRLGDTGEQLDARKIKWFDLPRIRESARVIAAATSTAGQITVRIHRRDAAHWYGLWGQRRLKFGLRNQPILSTGQQFPLDGIKPVLTDLTIARVDRDTGDVVLTGAVAAGLEFLPGSLLYSPRLTENGLPRTLVEAKVRAFVLDKKAPMNSDPDNTRTRDDPDTPKSIAGFKGPCNSSRLIGVFEGGYRASAGIYRPAGACKMRNNHTNGEDGEFCFVCRWLIVNRIDPSFHALLDSRFYPEPKER